MANKVFLGLVGPQVTLYGQSARPQPPMGLVYAMNSVRSAGWNSLLFDTLAEGYTHYTEDRNKGIRITGLPNEVIVSRLKELKPDFIGINLGVSSDHDYIRFLVDDIKKVCDCPVVLGGSEASLMHREILDGLPIERINADFVVTGRDLGSGEDTTYYLLKAIESGTSYEHIPGLAFKENEKLIVTKSVSVTEKSLAALSLPRRDLFSRQNGLDIYSFINQSHTGPVDYIPYAVMHTSRGCGGACTFCHTVYGDYDRTLMKRSLDNIIDELRQLKSSGVNSLSIEDDNFGGFSSEQTDLAVKILEEIEKLGFKGIYFPNGMTIRSMINNNYSILKTLRRLADKGTKVRNSLPAESGDERTLKELIRKPHNSSEVQAVLEELKRGYLDHENIDFDAFFMVGVVGYNNKKETEKSIQRTFGLADRVSDLGMRVNIWWMKPNPNGPQYKLWRQKYPEKPFYELQFSFPSGIWSSEDEENRLNERVRAKNREMNRKGAGSKRPIYPV